VNIKFAGTWLFKSCEGQRSFKRRVISLSSCVMVYPYTRCSWITRLNWYASYTPLAISCYHMLFLTIFITALVSRRSRKRQPLREVRAGHAHLLVRKLH
jgi:hypothetical protein